MFDWDDFPSFFRLNALFDTIPEGFVSPPRIKSGSFHSLGKYVNHSTLELLRFVLHLNTEYSRLTCCLSLQHFDHSECCKPQLV